MDLLNWLIAWHGRDRQRARVAAVLQGEQGEKNVEIQENESETEEGSCKASAPNACEEISVAVSNSVTSFISEVLNTHTRN